MSAVQIFEVVDEPAAASEPPERALDNPALWDHLEALRAVGPLDDLKRDARRFENCGEGGSKN